MKYLVLALVMVLVLVLSTFGIQNPTPVNVRFLQFQSGFVPLYVIMLVSTLIGMLLVFLVGLPGRIHPAAQLALVGAGVAAAALSQTYCLAFLRTVRLMKRCA